MASLISESPSLPRSLTVPATDGVRADRIGKAQDFVSSVLVTFSAISAKEGDLSWS